jgi:hypothetical protein
MAPTVEASELGRVDRERASGVKIIKSGVKMDFGSPARPYSWHLAPERMRRHSVT